MGGIEEGETLPEERQADGVALLVGGKDDVAGGVFGDIHGAGQMAGSAALEDGDARSLPALAARLPGFRVEEGEHLYSPLPLQGLLEVLIEPGADFGQGADFGDLLLCRAGVHAFMFVNSRQNPARMSAIRNLLPCL